MPVPREMDDFPHYDPRWAGSAWSGHRHTVHGFLTGPSRALDAFPSRRFEIPTLGDGDDRLTAHLFRPKGVSLETAPDCPLIVLLHGLGGHAFSTYMRTTALHLLEHGRDVVLLNFRGAGDSAGTCKKHHNPGRSDDIKALFEAELDGPLPGAGGGLFPCGAVAVGFSLGGNVLIKYLGDGPSPLVRAAMTVSAPLDLAATSRRLGRGSNLPYRAYLLGKLRYRMRTDPDGLSKKDSRRLLWTTSIWNLDERFTAPRNGYSSAEDYYADNSCSQDLPNVHVSTYLMHADDDPFVPSTAYREHDWSRNPRLVPLLTETGGHVGFIERGGTLWHNRCLTHLIKSLQAAPSAAEGP